MANSEEYRMKVFSEIGSAIYFLIAGAWLYSNPNFEPLVAFLPAAGIIFIQVYKKIKEGDVSAIFGKLLSPIIYWKEQNTPIAKIGFDTLENSNAVKHSIKAWRIWNDNGPIHRIELRHKYSHGSWYTFDTFEGHIIELETRDINNDGDPEILVSFYTGAHTKVLKIFRINHTHNILEIIPGAEFGSDWPEIKIEDKDGDKIPEVYAKHHTWNNNNVMEYHTEVYKYSNDKFKKIEKV